MTDQTSSNPDGWNPSHDYATQYAIEGLKALVLANGGAVVAILTFCGNAKDDRFDFGAITTALSIFAAGLVTTLLAMTCAYYAQANFTQSSQRKDEHDKRGDVFERAGGVFVGATLCLFVWGCLSAASAFRARPATALAVAPKRMSCEAAVAFIKAQGDRGPGTHAVNKSTGEESVLIGRSYWLVLPTCKRP